MLELGNHVQVGKRVGEDSKEFTGSRPCDVKLEPHFPAFDFDGASGTRPEPIKEVAEDPKSASKSKKKQKKKKDARKQEEEEDIDAILMELDGPSAPQINQGSQHLCIVLASSRISFFPPLLECYIQG